MGDVPHSMRPSEGYYSEGKEKGKNIQWGKRQPFQEMMLERLGNIFQDMSQ